MSAILQSVNKLRFYRGSGVCFFGWSVKLLFFYVVKLSFRQISKISRHGVFFMLHLLIITFFNDATILAEVELM